MPHLVEARTGRGMSPLSSLTAVRGMAIFSQLFITPEVLTDPGSAVKASKAGPLMPYFLPNVYRPTTGGCHSVNRAGECSHFSVG